MAKPNPSLLYVDPETSGPFVIKPKPKFEPLPQSDTLSRLRDFLPVMKQANEQLALQAKLDPKSVIIDGIDDEEDEEFDEGNPSEQAAEGQEKPVKQVIQMDLMLVPDDSDDDAEKMEGQIEAEEDEEDEEFDEEGNRLPLIERQVRAAARARKPQIEVVGGQDSEESNQ